MVEISTLAPPDFEAWLPLWRDYQAFYKADISDHATRLAFARLTSGEEPMGGLIARNGVEAIGIAHWIAHRSCWTSGDYCYLQDLFVAQGARGAGVGRRLIETVCALANKRACSRVYWLTHESNAPAMLLYDRVATKSGFVQYVKRL